MDHRRGGAAIKMTMMAKGSLRLGRQTAIRLAVTIARRRRPRL